MIKEGVKYLCADGSIVHLKPYGIGSLTHYYCASKLIDKYGVNLDVDLILSLWDKQGFCMYNSNLDIVGEG